MQGVCCGSQVIITVPSETEKLLAWFEALLMTLPKSQGVPPKSALTNSFTGKKMREKGL